MFLFALSVLVKPPIYTAPTPGPPIVGWNLIRVKPPGAERELTQVHGQGSQEPLGEDEEGTGNGNEENQVQRCLSSSLKSRCDDFILKIFS